MKKIILILLLSLIPLSVYGVNDGTDEIFPSGNVGIGTTSPAQKLDVYGDIQLVDTGPNINLNVSSGDNFGLHAETQLAYFKNDTDSKFYWLVDSLHNLQLVPYVTNGKVGINKGLGNPTYNLDVTGTIGVSGNLNLVGSSANIVLSSNYLSGDGGDEGVFVNSSGNVGIGTTSPAQILEVYNGNLQVTSYSDSTIQFLAHYDGADAATTHTNETGQVATFVGNAQLDTGQFKWTSSLLLDGTGDYITYPDNDIYQLGGGAGGDFTLSFWFRLNSDPNEKFCGQKVDANNEWYVTKSGSYIYFYAISGGTISVYWYRTFSASLNTWYHFEIDRSGNTWYCFIDGVNENPSLSSGSFSNNTVNIAAVFAVGAHGDGTSPTDGWIEEFEIKNTARHTANFTVPASPYSSLTGGDIYIDEKLGIGTTSPSTILDLLGDDNSTVQTIKINAAQASVTTADTYIDFRSTTGSEGSIAGTGVAGTLAYSTFTANHYTQIIDKTNLEIGMVLEIIDEKTDFTKQKIKYQDLELEFDSDNKPIMEIVSIDGKDVKKQKTKSVTKEKFISTEASPKPQLPKTRICQTKGSKAVLGAYGGTDKEGRDFCLSIGTGFIWVANKGKDIEIGDYLISSNEFGCAELQKDDLYRNSTVAKSTEKVIWKQGETKRLISCIYEGG